MKKYFSLFIFLISFSSFASVKIHEEAYVLGQKPEVVRELVETGSVIIDHVTSEGFEVYGNRGLLNYLDEKNIPYLDMQSMKQNVALGYPSFEEMTKKLKSLALKKPSITQLFSIGKSVNGKDLWVMKISDNAGMDEVEPEFKYISSMHGDEITGRELTVRLVEEIIEKYGKDNSITELVNNTEIFIMPSMNPDGSEMKRRSNAKWSDLNRNFPDITRDRESNSKGREVEVRAVMKFQEERQFSFPEIFMEEPSRPITHGTQNLSFILLMIF